jgi:hypothetical protein
MCFLIFLFQIIFTYCPPLPSVADPDPFDTDPDHAFHFYTDTDPDTEHAFQSNTYMDLTV